MPNALPRTVSIFLYGTLRPEASHHHLVAPWVIDSVPAEIWGRLYHVPAGYPSVEIPEEFMVAVGTANPEDDARAADRLPVPEGALPEGDWDWVQGDVVTLSAPSVSIPPLDDYEGFRPGRPSLYRRVLAPVLVAEETTLAWVYVRKSQRGDRRICDGVWTPLSNDFRNG